METSPLSPDPLLNSLIQAVDHSDQGRFTQLVEENTGQILQSFRDWARVPETIRANPSAVQRYGSALMVLAQYFEVRGNAALMEIIAGKTEENPLVRWQNAAVQAEQLHHAGQYAQSNSILLPLLDEMKTATGGFITEYLPRVYGWLGSNTFHLGDLQAADMYTRQAIAACEPGCRAEITGIYRDNLLSVQTAIAVRAQGSAASPEFLLRGQISRAQDLADGLRYQASIALLLQAMETSDTALLQPYRPKIFGLLGSDYYFLGDLTRAKEYTAQALEASRENQDDQGIRVYQVNLEVISKKQNPIPADPSQTE